MKPQVPWGSSPPMSSFLEPKANCPKEIFIKFVASKCLWAKKKKKKKNKKKLKGRTAAMKATEDLC